ncbi:O-antigen polymerase [Primorskyibacter sp. S87]|uniref:O-antigen polymerase n=1 Tax=Primorskyibacter sp. S87 TaxID=3415126 RepID=UPI003C79CB39
MRWFSPPALLAICWGLTFACAGLTLLLPGYFDLLPVFLSRVALDPSGFTWMGGVWLATAMLSLMAGDLAARENRRAHSSSFNAHYCRFLHVTSETAKSPPFPLPAAGHSCAINRATMFPQIDPRSDSYHCVFTPAPRASATPKHQTKLNLTTAARNTARLNGIFLSITLIWVLHTAGQNGGLPNLVALATHDALAARDLLLDNKLFTGMRLLYAALPATGSLAAAILSAGGRALPRRARRRCQTILILNTLALFLLPIVMSQRLLLLQFVLSSYIVTCLIRRRIVGRRWLLTGTVTFLSVWTLRESLTNPQFQHTALELALQKLAFYFVNDLWNSFAPLQADTPATLGAHTLQGVAILTFTDGVLEPLLAPRIATSDLVRGGGEFSLLTAPYVDFGLLGGALFLFGAGYVFRRLFQNARTSFLGAALYAQVGAALLFSSHGLYITHQNCLFSLVVIAVLCRKSSVIVQTEFARLPVETPAPRLSLPAMPTKDRGYAQA